jgi:hypothetical protein
MPECFQYHRKLFAEYVKAEVGNDVVQEVASTYVTVNMEGHLSLDPLPFCQYFISLQLAVPSLELQRFQTALQYSKVTSGKPLSSENKEDFVTVKEIDEVCRFGEGGQDAPCWIQEKAHSVWKLQI